MKLVSKLYSERYGFPPIFMEVGEIELDILPFTLGFFEAVMLGEIKSEREFDNYLRFCVTWAEKLILNMSGIILTPSQLDYIEDELFTRIVQRLLKCQGTVAEA